MRTRSTFHDWRSRCPRGASAEDTHSEHASAYNLRVHGTAAPLTEIEGLTGRSNRTGLLRLGAHAGLLLGTGVAIRLTTGSIWVAPALLAHGIVLVALFAGLHESVHRTAFSSRRLSDAVAATIGFLQLLPARHFRLFHLAHHRFTGNPAHDPELVTPRPASLPRYVRHVSGCDHWAQRFGELWRHARGRVSAPYVPEVQRGRIVREARWHAATYLMIAAGAVATGWTAPVLYWWLPLLVGQPWLRLVLLAEHSGCPDVPDMLENTRTTLTAAPVRFLMWNMPYHAEHHAWTGVPFHALPLLHERLADRGW